MRTFYIICKNFKLRFCVDLGALRQQKILVHLSRVCQQRSRAYQDLSVEYCTASAIDDSFVELAAGRMGKGVIYRRVIVDVLTVGNDVESVNNSFCIFSIKSDRQIMPREEHSVPALSTGDSVRHGSLGEGVVTRIEADGVVTVRFAADGSERRLMLEYAPLEKV